MGSKPRGISASRGAAVLGLSEFQTPFEVFQRIMEEREPGFNAARGYVLPPEPDSAAIRWGTAFEDAVVQLAEKKQGFTIGCREDFFSHYCNDFITCHIDGFYAQPSMKISHLVLHEGKTTSAFVFREKWGEPGTDRIPRIYQIQAQHQMLCTREQKVIVSVLVFPETPDKWETIGWTICSNEGNGFVLRHKNKSPLCSRPIDWAEVLCEMGYFHQYFVKANDTVQQQLVKAYSEFWERYVLTGTPPEPRNYEDIKRLCPEPKSTIIVPDYIERKIAEYKGINEEGNRSNQRKERLKTIVTKYAATHSGIVDDESTEAVIFRNASGDKLGSWSRNKNGSLIFRA